MAEETVQRPAISPTAETPGLAPPSENGEAAPQPSEADNLKAQLSVLQMERDRLSGDLKSVRGQLRKGLNDQARMDKIEQGIDSLSDAIVQLATEMSGDTELPQRMAAIRQKQQEARQTNLQSQQGQAAAKWLEIHQEVAIAEGINLKGVNQKRNLSKVQAAFSEGAEWAEVRQAMNEAFEAGDMDLLDEAVGKAAEVRQKTQEAKVNAKIAAEVGKARKEVEGEAHETLVKAGVFGTAAAGQASGRGAAGTHSAYVQRLKQGGPLPLPEEIDRIVAEHMKRQ